jgi:hypothetical protein
VRIPKRWRPTVVRCGSVRRPATTPATIRTSHPAGQPRRARPRA